MAKKNTQNDISIEIKGLIEAKAKLEQVAKDIHGKELFNTMTDATLIVTRAAKLNLSKPTEGVKYPTVNSGQLRNSITPEVYDKSGVLTGVVGSNLKHAPFMELGTGVFVGKARHAPPLEVLKKWVAQKNRGGKALNAYMVQRAIYKRGGLRPRKYLQRAVDDNRAEIEGLFEKKIKIIVSR